MTTTDERVAQIIAEHGGVEAIAAGAHPKVGLLLVELIERHAPEPEGGDR